LPDPQYTNFVARNVGCGSPCGGEYSSEEEAAAVELDCMRMASASQITNFIGQWRSWGKTYDIVSLIPDDVVVFSDYHALSEEGKFAHVPTAISLTAKELVSLFPLLISLTQGPDQDAMNDANIAWVCAVYNSTVYRNRLDIPIYRFHYAAEFPNLNIWDWLGTYHDSETSLVFGTYHLLDHIAPMTHFQVEVSQAI
jgi:hypothetical protein